MGGSSLCGEKVMPDLSANARECSRQQAECQNIHDSRQHSPQATLALCESPPHSFTMMSLIFYRVQIDNLNFKVVKHYILHSLLHLLQPFQSEASTLALSISVTSSIVKDSLLLLEKTMTLTRHLLDSEKEHLQRHRPIYRGILVHVYHT
jgi:hypothetical protein